MRFQAKLTAAFALVAIITLGVAVFAWWKVTTLGSAIYEVAAVRLPSIQGLNLIAESVGGLSNSERLLSTGSLNPAERREESIRQEEAWNTFEAGWRQYEPLPQTDEEAVLWKEFAPAARNWQQSYRAAMARVVAEESPTTRASAEAILLPHRHDYEETVRLLHALTKLNYSVAAAASLNSVASERDLSRQKSLMVLAGAAGFIGAGCVGLVMGRVLTRPARELAAAVARGRKHLTGSKTDGRRGDEFTEIADAFSQTAEDLRSSEARLELLSSNLVNSVIYQVAREPDGTMRFLYLSAPAERLFGVTREQLLGNASLIYERVDAANLPALVAAREESARNMSALSLEVRIRQANGESRWWLLKSAPRRLSDGRIIWDGLATDVHERVMADARLLESESRFRAVFDHSPDAIAVSRKGLTVFVNPAFTKLFGYEKSEDALNRSIFDFVAPSSHDVVRQRLADRAAGKREADIYELLGRHRDGTVFHVEIRSLPFSLGGEPHFLVLHRDVTVRRRIVDDIGRSNRALKRVRDAHHFLVHAADEAVLSEQLCNLFVQDGDYCFAWVATDSAANGALGPIAKSGGSQKNLEQWRESWPAVMMERRRSRGSPTHPKFVVARNFAQDPELTRWRADALEHGYASVIVLPLCRGTVLFGFIALYSSERTAFDQAEAELLAELAEDIAFSLVTIRDRTEHEKTERKVHALLSQAEQSRAALLSILEDQKRVEDALHRSEERFRSAMFNSAIGMALSEVDGRCSEVNPALCRILGYERTELVERPYGSLTHPDDTIKESTLFHELLEGARSTYELEKRLIRKDGSTVWAQANVSIVRDPTGKPLHFIAQIQDISERLRTAAAREEILSQLRLALEAGHLGTFRRNIRTGEGVWDEQTFKLMRRPLNLGTPSLEEFISLIHPRDRNRVERRLRHLPRGDEVSYACRMFMGDGSERHFVIHSVAEPAAVAGQEPEWVIGVISDISDFIRIQDDLATTAQRLKLSLSIAKLGVWRHDLQTGLKEWNDRMFEIYGLAPNAPLPSQETFISWIVDDDRAAAVAAWDEMIAGGKDYRVRYRTRRADGNVRHIEAHAMVQLDERERPKVVLGVNSDITDIVDAAAESARLREQLQQAQKMEALGTMAAGVAHDFNNLLTGINGFVGLAASSLPPGHEAGELLKQALRGAVNARDLVRRILDFSRGRGDEARSAIDVGDLIRDTAPLISAALPPNVSLSVAVDQDVPVVVADPGQLQQVLLNLCINGSHAIGAKKGMLTIGLREHVFLHENSAMPRGCRPGRYVCLSVTDSGSGMDDATRRRIFEPFFTTKKPGVGTGLGLSIVRDIVTGHAGGIDVTSQLGVGTTFLVYLPVGTQASPAKAALNGAAGGQGNGARILVINSETAIAMVLRLSLQKAGYSPEVYISSSDGWKRFSQMPDDFDLVIVDAGSVDPGARDLVQRVRSLRSRLPVIIMVDPMSHADFSDPSLDQLTSTLAKPFEVVALQARVRSALAARIKGEPSLP